MENIETNNVENADNDSFLVKDAVEDVDINSFLEEVADEDISAIVCRRC